MTEGELATPPPRRWLLRAAFALAALAALYVGSRAAFQVWMHAAVPGDAPRIAFSLDDTWLNELGVTDTTYQQAMTRAGGQLVRVLPDSAGSPVDPQRVKALLTEESIDAVLLTGGGDVDPALYGGKSGEGFLVNRQRDDFEIALIHAAREQGLPVLGICRGCQILNVAFGGTLRNLRDDEDLSGRHFTFTETRRLYRARQPVGPPARSLRFGQRPQLPRPSRREAGRRRESRGDRRRPCRRGHRVGHRRSRELAHGCTVAPGDGSGRRSTEPALLRIHRSRSNGKGGTRAEPQASPLTALPSVGRNFRNASGIINMERAGRPRTFSCTMMADVGRFGWRCLAVGRSTARRRRVLLQGARVVVHVSCSIHALMSGGRHAEETE